MRFPSFSAIKSLPTDADYNALLKNGFHGSSSMPDCANAVTSALGLMFFDPQGKLSTVTISKKVILDNGMSAGTFASLRDDLAQAIPVTIDPNELPKRVIGVGNNGRAVSPEDIDFTVESPTFCAVSVFCPLVPGSKMPPDLDLTQDIPEEVLLVFSPHERLWVKVHAFLFKNTSGKSLFVDETLVGKTSIPLDQFIVNEQPAAISENTLSTASGYEFRDARTGSESF
ncbi:unnamed protein product [Cylindrotheca closterium]|uniref:Uncharacterized protein n=1 Tax=Cylindrotheca closterium TaxID=2856 RepID=A0AAD2PU47_9STRA|nr:unnamed protein product [Cylindrotheca closterium]